jgi:hypothetical protein
VKDLEKRLQAAVKAIEDECGYLPQVIRISPLETGEISVQWRQTGREREPEGHYFRRNDG